MATTNQQIAKRIKARIQRQLVRAAGKGLDAAVIFLEARIKETVGNQPPMRKYINHAGEVRRVPITPVVPGAPPRKISGQLQQHVVGVKISETSAVFGSTVRSIGGFPYAAYHDVKTAGYIGSGLHPFVEPTVLQFINELRVIVGGQVRYVRF